MMNKSENLNEIFLALSKAQGQISSAIKDANNPFFKSSYATLDACWDCCRIPLSSNGLSLVQTVQEVDGKLSLCSILGHSSGQYISSTVPLLLTKNDPQSLGSCISYMRRYSLCALIGLTQDDDDGEAAMEHTRQQPILKKKVVTEQVSPGSQPNEEFDVLPFLTFLTDKFGRDAKLAGISFYIKHFSEQHGKTSKSIVDQAMRPEWTDKFMKGFKEWQSKQSEYQFPDS